MVVRSIVVTLLASSLFACGGASQTEAKGPETNPWADYKGTYATAGEAHAKPAKTEVAKSDAPSQTPVEDKVEEAPAPPPPVHSKRAKTGPKKRRK
jgi:hypothetical protein